MASLKELEQKARAWTKTWKVPPLLSRMGFPIGFTGLVGLVVMLLLSIARGVYFDAYGTLGWLISFLLFAGGIALNLPGFLVAVLEFFSPRRTVYGLNALVMVVGVFVIVVIVNYVGARHYLREDVTSEGAFELDQRTVQLLEKLDKKAEEKGADLYAYFHSGAPWVWNRMSRLLDEYRYRSAHFHYEMFTPVDSKRIAALCARLGIERDTFKPDSLILSFGEETRTVGPDEIVRMPRRTQWGPSGNPEFLGEDALSTALRDLLEEDKTICYFIQGHGEKTITPGAGNMGKLASELRAHNMKVQEWNLPETKHLPSDAEILIIADPHKGPFLPEEMDLMEKFLNTTRGGIIILMEPVTQSKDRVSSGLERLLLKYGIQPHDDKVVVQKQELVGWGTRKKQLAVSVGASSWGVHEVVSDFRQAGVLAYFNVACPVQIAEPANKEYKSEKLLWAPNTWGETAIKKQPAYEPDQDLAGPVTLVMLAEPKVQGSKAGKLLVIGDADIASDPVNPQDIIYKQVGFDLVLNAASDMVGKRENIGIKERKIVERQVLLEPAARNIVQYMVLLVLPLLVALFGLMVVLIRRF